MIVDRDEFIFRLREHGLPSPGAELSCRNEHILQGINTVSISRIVARDSGISVQRYYHGSILSGTSADGGFHISGDAIRTRGIEWAIQQL